MRIIVFLHNHNDTGNITLSVTKKMRCRMKKLFLFLILALLFTQTTMADGTLPSGSGTSGDPYTISTLNHLLWISTNSTSWDKVFLQTADIDASSTATWNSNSGWSLIGTGSNPFTGTYNGGGFTISGLTISRADHVQGFFGATSNASILNLTLSDVSISITGDQQKCGAIVAQNTNTPLSNCHTSGTVKGDDYVGGLIGINSGADAVISDCSFSGTVVRYANYTGNYIGGLIGKSESGAHIQDSHASATVDGKWYVGGLVGGNDASTIDRCYSTGNIGGDYYAGGLSGNNSNSSLINQCFSLSNVSANINVAGGLIGNNNGSTVSNGFSRGTVTRSQGSDGDFGGFIGKNENTTVIEYCYSTGTVAYTGATDPTDKGFIGNYNATGCSHNFFDSQTSVQSSGSGATATLTSDMNNYTTFITENWDFKGESTNGSDDIWNIGNGRNDDYPYFDWMYPGDDVPTPIRLSNFSVAEDNGVVRLSWETATETENSGFVIQRKISGSSWDNLVDFHSDPTLEGYGTTSESHSYSWLDQNVLPGFTYHYRLGDVDYNHSITWHEEIEILLKDEGSLIPDLFGLQAVFPNPFNPMLTIRYGLTEDAQTSVKILDLQGKTIATLENKFQKAGSYELQWQAGNKASGIYLVEVVSGEKSDMRKVLLTK